MVSADHVDIVVKDMPQGDVVIFMSDRSARALAVALHVFEDHPGNTLSPFLVPLLRTLDRKLAKAPRPGS